MTTSPGKVLIVGAGPAGLGAAWRFHELGYNDVTVLEASNQPGGLSASFVDSQGFTWDIGGHVLFSQSEYFNNLMSNLDGISWLEHQREAWIKLPSGYIPYPFQYNIHRLPDEDMRTCLAGILDCAAESSPEPQNFKQWLRAGFGQGLCDTFMYPYNEKVWAFPPERLAFNWIGTRVARLDLKRLVFNILDHKDDVNWGPNNVFRFPEHGGTGAIWKALSEKLPDDWIQYNASANAIDPELKTVHASNDQTLSYDTLISTMPLTELAPMCGLPLKTDPTLDYSQIHVFGIGLRGEAPEHLKTKCWIYFSDPETPFFRVTVFSNYSPNNVPDGHWSLMAEVSTSTYRKDTPENVSDRVINALIRHGLIQKNEKTVSLWSHRVEYGYPTPTLDRDSILEGIKPKLKSKNIHSIGRFGSWRYEVGNMDHSVLQGVNLVNELMDNTPSML